MSDGSYPGSWITLFDDIEALYAEAQKVVAPTPADRGVVSTGTVASVVNTVSVAIAPVPPTAVAIAAAAAANEPAPVATVPYVTVTSPLSVAQFGEQATPIVVTLLDTIEDATELAEHYIRAVPAYWFTSFRVMIAALTNPQKIVITKLEIGDQITVTKTFPAPASPTVVTQNLFVEGIDHDISIDGGHYATIYAGPAEIYNLFTLDSATLGKLDSVAGGLG